MILCVLLLVIISMTRSEQRPEFNETSRISRGLVSSKVDPTNLPAPDYFIIGAMKCATSSLNALMVTHPEICSEGDKEKHFFDHVGVCFVSSFPYLQTPELLHLLTVFCTLQ